MSDQEKALCPAASPYEPGWNDCDHIRGERIDQVAGAPPCPDEQAKDHENCEIWQKHNTKTPAAGVEIINLQSRRRVLMTSEDSLANMAEIYTKIGKALAGLYIEWLESPEGQEALQKILAEALKLTDAEK